ncbi:MAG: hypothetical protein WCT49_01980 [Candidatus Paceibacterota bacterium]|jgi:hypothetical protein|nr:hypothetical protein [Candidatus Paceibacterota bacterium]
MKKNLLIVLCLWFAVAFSAFADQNIETNAGAGATATTGGINYAPVTNASQPVFMPNGAPSVMPNPNTFIKGIGLAEKTNRYAQVFANFCKGGIPVNSLRSDRAKTVSDDTDFGLMVWQPYRDYFVRIRSEENAMTDFTPEVTDIARDFAAENMSPETTHYCIGHVAIRTLFDEEIQDITLQETLINEALRFASDHITGFANVTPVILYETNAYYDGTAVNGSGISVTPQVSGIPAAGVAAGSIFSWGKNHGLASSSFGLGMKVIFLAQAPNPTEGHPIALEVQKINRIIKEMNAPKPVLVPPEVVVVEKPIIVKKVVNHQPKKAKPKKVCKKWVEISPLKK